MHAYVCVMVGSILGGSSGGACREGGNSFLDLRMFSITY